MQKEKDPRNKRVRWWVPEEDGEKGQAGSREGKDERGCESLSPKFL